ncbi:MAG: ABC transporter permease [SAR202 cluster bacterium]|jgi:ABC-2 type transport system permease protein|nr:ABC transporter permease [SAR202 cluster bacterium]
MRPTIALTLASLKMFYRNRQAVFFSLFLPFLIMGIFGILNFDSFSDIKVGVVDEAENGLSSDLIQALGNTDVLDVTLGARAEQVEALEEGDLDLLIILPEAIGKPLRPIVIEGLYNANRPQEAEVAETVLARMLDDLTFSITGESRLFRLETQEVKSREFEYVDFLVPGIIAMSIMQIGLFSVTFSVIRYRAQGVLRRLMAAPIHPAHFLAGQVITRLTVSVFQTLVLLVTGIILLGINVHGSYATLILLAIIGGGLFISMGYAISGFARTEESAAPITNLIAMPMMFLSGVFFSRDNLPAFLETVTEYFPLTYLADSMREVTAEGAGLVDIWGDLLGLSVWLVTSFVIATRVFKWE